MRDDVQGSCGTTCRGHGNEINNGRYRKMIFRANTFMRGSIRLAPVTLTFFSQKVLVCIKFCDFAQYSQKHQTL